MTTDSITSAALALPPESREALADTLLLSLDLQSKFQRNCDEWKAQSQLLSQSAKMAMLPSYQRIIGLGRPAIPLILAELRREPDHWFWALESLTGENPVPDAARGDLAAMTRAWLDWGRRHGYLPA